MQWSLGRGVGRLGKQGEWKQSWNWDGDWESVECHTWCSIACRIEGDLEVVMSIHLRWTRRSSLLIVFVMLDTLAHLPSVVIEVNNSICVYI